MLPPRAEAAIWHQQWEKGALSCSLQRILAHPLSLEIWWTGMHDLTDSFCFLVHPLKRKCTWAPTPCPGHFPSSPTSNPSLSALLVSSFSQGSYTPFQTSFSLPKHLRSLSQLEQSCCSPHPHISPLCAGTFSAAFQGQGSFPTKWRTVSVCVIQNWMEFWF